MTDWQDYPGNQPPRPDSPAHTVTGTLKVLQEVYSPQLDNRRDILVYLPPSYASATDRRYPVLYLHDGQNLFDAATSYAGEWRVDETLESLAAEGLEAIAVGVPHMGVERVDELSPFEEKDESRGLGDRYLAFIIDTVKPLVDAFFRTRPERDHTALIGSSMGGLITLYGFFQYPEVFGLAGAFSPALWFGRRGIFRVIEQTAFVPGRLYVDVGTQEGTNLVSNDSGAAVVSTEYLASVDALRDLLVAKGYATDEGFKCVVEQGAIHHEHAWARRLPDALRFLLQ